MNNIRKLILDPYVNIILSGGPMKETLLIEWASTHERVPTLLDSSFACTTTRHGDMIYNIWNVGLHSGTNSRYFFPSHIEHTFIAMSARSENTGNFTEYIGSVASLCPNVEISLLLIFQAHDIEDKKCLRNAADIEEHAKAQGISEIERVVIGKEPALLTRFVEQIKQQRKAHLNDKFRTLYRSHH